MAIQMIGRGTHKSKLTRNYNRFKFLPEGFNRPVTARHVKEIGLSIADVGVQKPVLIIRTKAFSKTGQWEEYIGDSQHMYTELVRLKEEIPYLVKTLKTKAAVVKLITRLNNCGKSWTNMDYVRSWAGEGRKAYKRLLTLSKEYRFGLTELAVMFGHPDSDLVRRRRLEDLKEGGYKINQPGRSNKILDFMGDIFYEEGAPLARESCVSRRFAQNFALLYKTEPTKYKHKQFMHAVRRNKRMIEGAATHKAKILVIDRLFKQHFA